MTPITPEIRRIWAETPLAVVDGVPQREKDSATIIHERLQGRPNETYVLCNAGPERWLLIDVIFGTEKKKKVRVKKKVKSIPSVVPFNMTKTASDM